MSRPTKVAPRAVEAELLHFEEACELVRHYSALRFRQLTIFAGINGGLLFVVFRQAGPVTSFEIYSCAVFGVFTALAFMLLEYRLMNYLDHYRGVVRDYEDRFQLVSTLYGERHRSRYARGRLAVFLFVFSAAIYWVVVGVLGAGMGPLH